MWRGKIASIIASCVCNLLFLHDDKGIWSPLDEYVIKVINAKIGLLIYFSLLDK
jgi:hypothetical protein